MTVQELIDLLINQDLTDIVMIETKRGCMPIEDDWARCHFYHDGERHHGFVLLAYDETDTVRIKEGKVDAP